MNAHRLTTELIDRELGDWLRDESTTRAPAGLVEDVFARTSRERQARRWWPPIANRRSSGRRPWFVAPGRERSILRPSATLAGIAVVVALAVVVAVGTRQVGPGPGTTSGPSSAVPTPSTSPSPPTPGASASTAASGTPRASGTRIDLGPGAAPIDVVQAFGSVWVADIHGDDVRRYDPATGRELARVPLTSASWFGVTGDGLWVTTQNATGITRIDPTTSGAREHVGDAPPCGAPVVTATSVWLAECDGDVFVRIDPATHKVLDTIPADGHAFLVAAGGRLITSGPEGLAAVDPRTGRITAIGGRTVQRPDFLTSDGTTVWVKNTTGVVRLDPSDGSVIASFSYPAAKVVTFAGDHAWLTVENVGALEIDLATNAIRRTIPVLPTPLVAREADGVLWVTDFDQNALWRIALQPG